MLRNLRPVIDSTPFAIRVQLAKTYLIPVLIYGSEFFANCDTDDRRKLNLIYNNVARYLFIYLLNNIGTIYPNFLTGYICIILVHKIITNRGKKIIQCRCKTISLLNTLPNYIQNIDNAIKFKMELYKLFK